jgi:hypothetical protein
MALTLASEVPDFYGDTCHKRPGAGKLGNAEVV